jgi:GWxTD domain-containing protein
MKLLIVFVVLLSITLSAQVERSQRTFEPLPVFYYDALNYRSTQPGKTRVDLYVEMPYRTLQFIKSDKGFSARYTINASIMDEDNEKLIVEKSWNETVNSADFQSTISKNNYYLSAKSFDLIPGQYTIRCEVEDQDSKKSYVREDKFTARDLSDTVAISDLMLIDHIAEVNGQKRYVPNIERNVGNQQEGVSVYFEVYSDTTRNIIIDYVLPNTKDEDLYSEKDTITVNKGANNVYHMLKKAQLVLGEYKLTVNVENEKNKVIATAFKTFFSRWVGVPNSVQDLDKAIDEMVYIAKGSDIDYIKEAPNKEEKLKRFLAFWKSKDPSPNSEENEVFNEYYRRVAYANIHFKHYIEGWRTDMGMVYITLGPPNNVERHPFEYDSKPYEVWDYYDINKSFIFVDETGFGDYRLINPDFSSYWRYRQ